MSMTVKAYLKRGENANAEIRRFVVDETVTSSYEYLSKKVAQVFPSLGSPDNFSLSWKDSEGDLITFSSDDELLEALGHLSEDIFRVYVKVVKKNRRDGSGQNGQTATDGPAPSPKGPEEEVFHPGIICDGCEGHIRGPRFKCITCPDYDLCKQCEGRGVHPEHTFVKFRKPQIGRSHLGGFFNRPGMFRQFGHPGWRRWWAWNQQQQQEQQQDGGPGPSTEETQGGAAPGPHGPGICNMGPGLFGGPPPPPPPHPHMPPPPPPPHAFLRDIGQTVAQMLDPLGIDVDIDIDHAGQRTHCSGEQRFCGGRGGGGKHGRRHGKGRRGCRNTWAGCEQGFPEQDGEEDVTPVAKETSQGAGTSSGAEASETPDKQQQQQQQTESGKDKPAAEPMEMGESGSGANGGPKDSGSGNGVSRGASGSGSDDADWTMVDDGIGNPVPSLSPRENGSGDAPPFKYQNALTQMLAMGFNNDGGWLTSLLLAKEGDIGGVLDAIKIGNQPKFNVNLK